MSFRVRRNRGSIAALAFIGMVPLIGALGGLAVDIMHVNTERGALQRATDAAALAGANDLASFNGANGSIETSYGAASQEMLDFALKVGLINVCDGRPVVTDGMGDTVTASAVVATGNAPPYTTVLATGGNQPNGCAVTGTMIIRSLMLTIFGNFFGSSPTNFGTTVSTYSLATSLPGTHGFPIAMSYTDPSPPLAGTGDTALATAGQSLSAMSVGSVFGWGVHGVNSMWTGGTSSHADSVVRAAEGSYGTPNNITTLDIYSLGGIGPITSGSTLDTTNGTQANSEAYITTLPAGTLLWMPVISNVGTNTIVGFVLISYGGYNGQTGSNMDFWGTIVQMPKVTTTGIIGQPTVSLSQ